MTATPNIELRKIKHAAFLSEETQAYSAELWLDGRLLAHVSNDGHGGCDMQHAAKGRTNDEIAALNTLIKTTFPAKQTDLMLEGKPFIMDQDLETVCGDLLTEHLLTRDLTRLLNRTVAFVNGDGKVRSYTGKQTEATKAALIKHTETKHPGAKILNAMPFAEALAVYRKTAAC